MGLVAWSMVLRRMPIVNRFSIAYHIVIVRFVEAVLNVIGAFVLLSVFVVSGAVLHSIGFETAGAVVGWLGAGMFLMSLAFILLEPLVRAFREVR